VAICQSAPARLVAVAITSTACSSVSPSTRCSSAPVVEPSGFATDWAGSSMTVYDIPAVYDATIGAMHRRVRANAANAVGAAGDPDRAAEIIVRTVKRGDPPAHLLLGVTAVEMALDYSARQLAEASAWEKVSRSADYAEPYPAALPPA
jgi:hypothetical protein